MPIFAPILRSRQPHTNPNLSRLRSVIFSFSQHHYLVWIFAASVSLKKWENRARETLRSYYTIYTSSACHRIPVESHYIDNNIKHFRYCKLDVCVSLVNYYYTTAVVMINSWKNNASRLHRHIGSQKENST